MGQGRAALLSLCLGALLLVARAGHVLPLHHRHTDPARGRRLLRNASLPLQGSLREYGYFFATLQLGTPARHFSVIVDTGSTVTYIPCSNCGAACGEHHQDAAFDPAASNTSALLGCGDPGCRCGRQSCGCANGQCTYIRRYAEQSSSEGVLVRDKLHLPDGTADVVFGCETRETGEIFKQAADGLMGLGSSDISIVNQLAGEGVTEDLFSLCYGSIEGDGALMLGDVVLPPWTEQLAYSPMVQPAGGQFYMVSLEQLSVGGKALPFNRDGYGGTILDSGTTFTYVPGRIFETVRDLVAAHVEARGLYRVEGGDPDANDICWGGGPTLQHSDTLGALFPAMQLQFAGGVNLTLPPQNYLFAHFNRDGAYCLGVFPNTQDGTLLGGITFRDVLVQYDRRNARVGFTPAPCQAIGRGEVDCQPGTSAAGAPCREVNLAMKTADIVAKIMPEDSSSVQVAAMVGAIVLLAAAAVLGVFSFVQSRRRKRVSLGKLSAGEEHDEISLISPVPSRRGNVDAALPK